MANFNLVFNTDQNYLFYCFVTAQTVVDALEDRTTNDQDKIIFHVLIDEGVDQSKAAAFRESFLKFNENAKVNLDLVLHQLDSSLFSSCITMEREGRSTVSIYYRLLFARFLPEDVEMVLYIDVDTFINADIRRLFEQCPMQEELLYATHAHYYLILSKNPLDAEPLIITESVHDRGRPLKHPVRSYLHSGVLLINVKRWRQQNIEQKCLDISKQWKWQCHDQDILTFVCQGQISEMPLEWNVTLYTFSLNLFKGVYYNKDIFVPIDKMPFRTPTTKQDIQRICEHPKLVHFTALFKPWMIKHKLSFEDKFKYKESLPYMMRWLQAYGRLSQACKS